MHLPPVPLKTRLINTPAIELWPPGLLRARGHADARALARARAVLRRKRDGRCLAAVLDHGLLALVPRLAREHGLDQALDALEMLESPAARRGPTPPPAPLPLDQLHLALDALDIDADAYAARTGLGEIAEPDWLAFAGFDRWRRPVWLALPAARAWLAMRGAARADGVLLDAISGYRSHAYQLGIFQRKLARGQETAEILKVNAAPGYSEHHGGHALDIGTPGQPPAEESFEHTPAFAWLLAHAGRFGFTMSYPRDNPHGIIHEPWHWRHRAGA